MLTIAKIQDCVHKVFGDESYNVRILQAGYIFKVEIRDMVHDGVWIRSEDTMEAKVMDIFNDWAFFVHDR